MRSWLEQVLPYDIGRCSHHKAVVLMEFVVFFGDAIMMLGSHRLPLLCASQLRRMAQSLRDSSSFFEVVIKDWPMT